MSGPIVRKYGFPNFEQIFGKRELEHGVDEPEGEADPAATPADTEKPAAEKPAKKGKTGKT
jgi:hypothetical protein